jgi:hypothetical protein
MFAAPLQQFGVSRVLSESVFRLLDIVTALASLDRLFRL